MSLLVTGSIGLDTLETPAGRRDDVLGGSAIYFSVAASYFAPVRLVGVVGADFPRGHLKVFDGRAVDASGLESRAGSRTFRWHGSYLKDLNNADTVKVDLNVLAEHAPKIPAGFRDSRFVFLANTHPALQQEMLGSLEKPTLVVADTMNLWIGNEKAELLKLLGKIDGLVLNDGEARQLSGESNLIAAAKYVLGHGPRFVIVKKGEHGSLLVTKEELFVLPACPVEKVIDPTGAGDSFAGGIMGYLASVGSVTPQALRTAIGYGTVMGSCTISDFSLAGLARTSRAELDAGLESLRGQTRI
jgi:cytidine kinase